MDILVVLEDLVMNSPLGPRGNCGCAGAAKP